MKRTRLITLVTIAVMLILPALYTVAANNNRKPERPDLQQIREEVTDYESPFYYPKLRAAYEKNDTVMTPEQYRYFYLGYMFQEDFNPYRESEFAVDPDSLAYKTQKHTPAELDSIISRAERSLKDNPFDLEQMSFIVYALKNKRKDMRAKIWQYRLENILKTIEETGTGETPEDAWFVISPDHEYALINALSYTAVGYDDKTPGIDYIKVEPNVPQGKRLAGKKHEGFYFNVRTLQEEYDRKFGSLNDEQPAVETIETIEVIDPDDVEAEE